MLNINIMLRWAHSNLLLHNHYWNLRFKSHTSTERNTFLPYIPISHYVTHIDHYFIRPLTDARRRIRKPLIANRVQRTAPLANSKIKKQKSRELIQTEDYRVTLRANSGHKSGWERADDFSVAQYEALTMMELAFN